MSEISVIVFGLILALLAHLFEEVHTGFRKNFPIGEMPKPVFVGINLTLYTFCFVTLLLAWLGHPLAIPLGWVFALIMLVNGVGHIGIMAYRRAYFPGGITAFLLVASSIYLIHSLLRAGDPR